MHPPVEGLVQKQIGQPRTDDPALRRTLPTLRPVAVLLRWGFQPPLDVEDHPLLLRVLLRRPPQEIMVDVVERSITFIPLSIPQPPSQRRSGATAKSPTRPTHSLGIVSRCVPPLPNGRRRIMCLSRIKRLWSSAFRAP